MKKAVCSLIMLMMAFALVGCQEENGTDVAPDRSPELTDKKDQLPDEPIVEEKSADEGINTVEVVLYLPDDNAEGFETVTAEIEDTPEALVDKLVEEGALPARCELLDFSPTEDYSTAVINMNKEFGEAVKSMGTAGERMLLGAVVNTFLTKYGLNSVSVIIDGQTLETGHAIYDFELTFFE